jgi:hypothetical protein
MPERKAPTAASRAADMLSGGRRAQSAFLASGCNCRLDRNVVDAADADRASSELFVPPCREACTRQQQAAASVAGSDLNGSGAPVCNALALPRT